jgi:hypothetical protein
MNERIKQLMPKPWTWPYPDRELYTKEQFEKFAELIVQECAEVADNADATREKWQSISVFIKERFGVK